jgi:class 3 adenylate cyclase
VRAAIDLVGRLPALNERLAEQDLPPLRIGIGIRHGDVVVGRIGPDERTDTASTATRPTSRAGSRD